MKNNLVFIIIALLFSSQIQAQRSIDSSMYKPSFPNGNNALDKFISTKGIYPQEAINLKQEGIIELSFWVEIDGSITNLNCKTNKQILCNESIRIIKLMPKWEPAKINGKAFKAKHTLAIGFKLQNKQITHVLLPSNIMVVESPNGDENGVDNSLLLAPNPIKAEEVIVTFAEQMPEFNGNLMAYLTENIVYPPVAAENNLEAKIITQFVVESDGSISNVEILQKKGWGFDEEALRIVKSMPNWKPGKQNGKPVRVLFTLPISFKLK